MEANFNHSERYQPPRQQPGNGPSALAWVTLIAGLGSWVAVPLIGATVALVCGFIERRKIAEGTSAPEGKTMVTIGLVAAGIQMALIALAVMALLFLGLLFALGLMVA